MRIWWHCSLFLFVLIISFTSCTEVEPTSTQEIKKVPLTLEPAMRINPDTVTAMMPSTSIAFRLEADAFVTLYLMNSRNQVVLTLTEHEYYYAGYNMISFSADKIASGVYYFMYYIQAVETDQSASGVLKLVVVK